MCLSKFNNKVQFGVASINIKLSKSYVDITSFPKESSSASFVEMLMYHATPLNFGGISSRGKRVFDNTQ